MTGETFKGHYRVLGGKWLAVSISCENGCLTASNRGQSRLGDVIIPMKDFPTVDPERFLRTTPGQTKAFRAADFSEENLRKVPAIVFVAVGVAIKEILEDRLKRQRKDGGSLSGTLALTAAVAAAGAVFAVKDKKSYLAFRNGCQRFDLRVRNRDLLRFKGALHR